MLIKNAENGDVEAQFNLATSYYFGKDGFEKNLKSAFEWYYLAATQGDAMCKYNVGIMYRDGEGIEQNYEKAIKWLTDSAENGYAFAQNDLGCLYEDGLGVEKDEHQAIKWYKEAANQGNKTALLNMGDCYFNGVGVGIDFSEAKRWYEKAVAKAKDEGDDDCVKQANEMLEKINSQSTSSTSDNSEKKSSFNEATKKETDFNHKNDSERTAHKVSQSSVSTQNGSKNDSSKNPMSLIIVLAIVILSVGGFFLYSNVIEPNQVDKAAPRYYTFAPSVMLRSSKNAGVDYNKVASLLYGTELITYNKGVEWSEVKVNLPGIDGKKPKGFVASQFILNKTDFFLLHSIWGDMESKEVIASTKCRRALIYYYKSKRYIGKLSVEEASELSLPRPQSNNQWQVFCLPKTTKTNNVYFKRILRKDSKFTDFAVIIKNIVTGERKLLFFYFEDDETPHIAAELNAPAYGTIEKITLKTTGDNSYLDVTYTK